MMTFKKKPHTHNKAKALSALLLPSPNLEHSRRLVVLFPRMGAEAAASYLCFPLNGLAGGVAQAVDCRPSKHFSLQIRAWLRGFPDLLDPVPP
jgi:hypothetical protein